MIAGDDILAKIPAKILARARRDGECLIWMGARHPRGYGRVWDGERRRTAYPHRWAMEEILGRELSRDELVDHICHTPPCLEPSHLRVCTSRQNAQNRSGPQRNGTSGFRGVTWSKVQGKWVAQVQCGNRNHRGGVYDTAEQAADAARALRLKLFTHSDADRIAATDK